MKPQLSMLEPSLQRLQRTKEAIKILEGDTRPERLLDRRISANGILLSAILTTVLEIRDALLKDSMQS